MSWEMSGWAKKTRGHRNSPQKLVLMVLADYYSDDPGYAFPAHATLAADCEMSRRSVIRHLQALHDDGYIIIEPQPDRRRNHYLFPHLGSGDTMAQQKPEAVTTDDQLGVPLVAERCAIAVSHKPTIADIEPTPNDTSTSVPVSLEQTPAKKSTPTVSQEFRKRMVSHHSGTDPNEINDAIDLALLHKSAKNYPTWELYVQGWLNRGYGTKTKGATNGGLSIPRGIAAPDGNSAATSPADLQKQIIADRDEWVRRNNERTMASERPSESGGPGLQIEPVPDL